MPTKTARASGRRPTGGESDSPSVGSIALSIGAAIGPVVAAIICLQYMVGWSTGGSMRIEASVAAIVGLTSVFSLGCALVAVRSSWLWFAAMTLGAFVALPTIAGVVHSYPETSPIPAVMGAATAAGVFAAYMSRQSATKTLVVVVLGLVVWLSLAFGLADALGADVRGLYERNLRNWIGVYQLAGIAGHPNGMGLYAGLAVLLQWQWLVGSPAKLGARVVLWVLGPVASVTALVWTQSRTAWIATSVVVAICLLIRLFRTWLWLPTLFLSLLAVAAVLLPMYDFGLHGRWFAWQVVWESTAGNWLTGVGPYFFTSEFWEEWRISNGRWPPWEPMHAHNQFMESLGLLGVLGAALCLLAFFVLVRTAGKVRLLDRGWLVAAVGLFLLNSGPEVPFGVGAVASTFLPVLVLAALLGLGWRAHSSQRE